MWRHGGLASLLGWVTLALVSASAHAAPSDVDPTFGEDGRVTTGFGDVPSSGVVTATATRRDGKIFALQELAISGGSLARYRASGRLDRSFGQDGRIAVPLARDSLYLANLALDREGRIVVVGTSESRLVVIRYLPTGGLDRSFGGDGLVRLPGALGKGFGGLVALQPDGRILMVPLLGERRAVLRLKTGGRLDPSFSGDGIARVPIGGIGALGVQRNGVIVVAGTNCRASCYSVVRLNPDGSRDRGWSRTGVSTTKPFTPFGRSGGSSVTDLEIQRNGRIILAGTRDAAQPLGHPGSWATAVRYKANGGLDRSFGGDGIATTAPAGIEGRPDAVAFQRRGQIVLAGGGPGAAQLVRFTHRGRLDRRFGGDGVVEHGSPGVPLPEGLVVRRNGKIVVPGSARSCSPTSEFFDCAVDGLAVMHLRINGNLDRRFSGDGLTFNRPTEPGPDKVRALAVQDDGKIVAVGAASRECVGDSASEVFCSSFGGLARYRPGGGLDENFGQDGLVRTALGDGVFPPPGRGGGSVGLGAAAVALQGDRQIVVAGAEGVARYNPDGSLDQSFGTGGISRREGAIWLAISIQPDGKVVVAGDGQVARYNPDGSLDGSFGTGGIVAEPQTAWTAMVIQDDGRVLVAGSRIVGCGLYECLTEARLRRYNPDGSVDSSFGDGGAVTDGSRPRWRALALQPDGRMVVAGTGPRNVIGVGGSLARYNPDGAPDATFGDGGSSESGVDSSALALQADGRIVVAGGDHLDQFPYVRAAVARYDSGGSLDPSFGEQVIPFEGGPESSVAIALQADGRILLGADAGNDFALARLLGG